MLILHTLSSVPVHLQEHPHKTNLAYILFLLLQQEVFIAIQFQVGLLRAMEGQDSNFIHTGVSQLIPKTGDIYLAELPLIQDSGLTQLVRSRDGLHSPAQEVPTPHAVGLSQQMMGREVLNLCVQEPPLPPPHAGVLTRQVRRRDMLHSPAKELPPPADGLAKQLMGRDVLHPCVQELSLPPPHAISDSFATRLFTNHYRV